MFSKQLTTTIKKILKKLLLFLLAVASMEIDPLSGNLYYVDGHSFTINVIDSSGKFFRNLTAPPTSSTVFWKIQALALDIVHK